MSNVLTLSVILKLCNNTSHKLVINDQYPSVPQDLEISFLFFFFSGYWHVPTSSFCPFISVFGSHSLVSIIIIRYPRNPLKHVILMLHCPWKMASEFLLPDMTKIQSKQKPAYECFQGIRIRKKRGSEVEAAQLRYWNHLCSKVRPCEELDFLEQANKHTHAHTQFHF